MSAAGEYEFLVGLLVFIVVLELVARKLRLPPAAAFILGGTALALVPGVPTFSIDPDLVLLVFLPPLLMNGGWMTVWAEFRANLGAISMLAIGAVAFTTAAVGLVAHAMVPGLPWAVCFALGAIVSPPDAVAAAAVLKRLSIPSRLTATLEGESLLNDASGLVLFRFALAAALTGGFDAAQFGVSFVMLTVGGVALGWAMGLLGALALRRLADSDLAIALTLLLPVASYVGGERLGVSGVLATVTAGIVLGREQHKVLSASTRIRAQAFWRVLVFLLESTLFILIGLAVRDVLKRLAAMPGAGKSVWLPVLGVVLTTIVARFVWVYATWAGRHVVRALRISSLPEPSIAVATVLGWAGMRGVVTLAAALSLPLGLPGRDFVLVCAFSVILVTVLLQGTTLGPLITRLRISGADELADRENSADDAWAQMMEAQYQAIVAESRQPDGSERHPRLLEQYGRRASLAKDTLTNRDEHRAAKEEHHRAVLAAISAGRLEVLRLHATGAIHDAVLRSLERELDLQQLVFEGTED